jgi:hypothetical protein
VFELAKAAGFNRLVLAGKSDLAEIAILCAVEAGVTIVAVIDRTSEEARFVGIDVCKTFSGVVQAFDAVIVTDVTHGKASFDEAVEAVGAERVLAPALLKLKPPPTKSAEGAT